MTAATAVRDTAYREQEERLVRERNVLLMSTIDNHTNRAEFMGHCNAWGDDVTAVNGSLSNNLNTGGMIVTQMSTLPYYRNWVEHRASIERQCNLLCAPMG